MGLNSGRFISERFLRLRFGGLIFGRAFNFSVSFLFSFFFVAVAGWGGGGGGLYVAEFYANSQTKKLNPPKRSFLLRNFIERFLFFVM